VSIVWRSLTEALTATCLDRHCPTGPVTTSAPQWTQHTGVPESRLLGLANGWRCCTRMIGRPTRQLWTNSVAGRGPYGRGISCPTEGWRVPLVQDPAAWPIRDSEGRTFKWFGTCTDITDGKLAAEELRLAKEAGRVG